MRPEFAVMITIVTIVSILLAASLEHEEEIKTVANGILILPHQQAKIEACGGKYSMTVTGPRLTVTHVHCIEK